MAFRSDFLLIDIDYYLAMLFHTAASALTARIRSHYLYLRRAVQLLFGFALGVMALYSRVYAADFNRSSGIVWGGAYRRPGGL